MILAPSPRVDYISFPKYTDVAHALMLHECSLKGGRENNPERGKCVAGGCKGAFIQWFFGTHLLNVSPLGSDQLLCLPLELLWPRCVSTRAAYTLIEYIPVNFPA